MLNDDGTLNIMLEVNMGISGVGRKKPNIVKRWQELSKDGMIEVPGLGNMIKRGGDEKWFFWNKELTASDDEIYGELLEASRAVLSRLNEFF